jgi:hypothetical protein
MIYDKMEEKLNNLESISEEFKKLFEVLEVFKKKSQEINVETPEGWKYHTASKKELLVISSLVRKFDEEVNDLAQNESAIITNSIKKQEASLEEKKREANLEIGKMDVDEKSKNLEIIEKDVKKNNREKRERSASTGLTERNYINAASRAIAASPKTSPTSTEQHPRGILPMLSEDLFPYKVAEGVIYYAVPIQKLEDCYERLGKVCFYPKDNRFYFVLNGFILDCTPANFTPYDQAPIKFTLFDGCLDKKGCDINPEKTTYYVSPLCNNKYHYGPKDRRSFTEKMVFASLNSDPSAERPRYCIPSPGLNFIAESLPMMTPFDLETWEQLGGACIAATLFGKVYRKNLDKKRGI